MRSLTRYFPHYFGSASHTTLVVVATHFSHYFGSASPDFPHYFGSDLLRLLPGVTN